ncbi:MAG TPA: hypothetical protein VFG03_00800 [Telluria sp.]|nr:hypothetical protein [Telluria sp.]
MANLTDLTTLPGLEAIRRLASSYPTPTNAQAVAALDSFSQPDAASLIGDGVREDVASSFLLPDGVFPRMRLLAWGWTKKGDKFKSPQDASWWRARYQYPLWQPIETYFDQMTRNGNAPSVLWDELLAKGDPAELSYAVSAVVQQDLPPVNEAPCPRWLIPPGRGMLPIANPSCLEKPVRDEVDKVYPKPVVERADWSWLVWIALGYLALRDKR